jgi:hypothetical protein
MGKTTRNILIIVLILAVLVTAFILISRKLKKDKEKREAEKKKQEEEKSLLQQQLTTTQQQLQQTITDIGTQPKGKFAYTLPTSGETKIRTSAEINDGVLNNRLAVFKGGNAKIGLIIGQVTGADQLTWYKVQLPKVFSGYCGWKGICKSDIGFIRSDIVTIKNV